MAGGSYARLTGDKELLRALSEVAGKILEAGGDAVEAWGEAVRDEAQRRVPIDTGNLGSAIESRPDRTRLKVEVGVWEPDADYSPFVESGTSSMEAQPFLGPAAEKHRDVRPFASEALAKRLGT